MPTTPRDVQALTYLAKRLREETSGANAWDENGIQAITRQLAGQNLASAIERVTRHSADPEAKTPGAILRPFLPDRPNPIRYPAKAGEDCRSHPGEYAEGCRSCAADRLAGDQAPAPRERRRSERVAEHVARLRDAAGLTEDRDDDEGTE